MVAADNRSIFVDFNSGRLGRPNAIFESLYRVPAQPSGRNSKAFTIAICSMWLLVTCLCAVDLVKPECPTMRLPVLSVPQKAQEPPIGLGFFFTSPPSVKIPIMSLIFHL